MADHKPELWQLARELKDLMWSEVKAMAIQLKIKHYKLERIERKYSDDNERLNSVMNLWLAENEASCWKNIVDALRAIEKNSLAADIQKRYCQPLPASLG